MGRHGIAASITARHEQLTQNGVLTYTPSLSHAVQDALFSYWRLPLSVKRAIDDQVPAFTVDSDAHALHVALDWHAFHANLASTKTASAVHCAWALALRTEKVFDQKIAPHMSTTALPTDDAIANHNAVRKLLQLIEPAQGDFYMAFLVLITLLEKALYDLYHHHHHQNANSVKKKNMILRDLLHSEVVGKALPVGLVALLKIVFLPSGLNLRNLVWHGFLIPAEFPRCFACLTALLLLELPRYYKPFEKTTPVSELPQSESPLFQLESFNDKFLLPPQLLRVAVGSQEDATIVPAHHWLVIGAEEWLGTSTFIPKGRERIVERAFHKHDHGHGQQPDELWFLFALLPVLEHALRLQFVTQNNAAVAALGNSDLLLFDDFAVAQLDQYYSTLDGFGQRDKHQVLLHADLAPGPASSPGSGRRNALYQTTPLATLAVCLDLFMMANGPNVRAKLCHGEADLTTLLPKAPSSSQSVSTITQLIALAWLSLCHHQQQHHQQALLQASAVLESFHRSVRSSFHPFGQLTRQFQVCVDCLESFLLLQREWSRIRVVEDEEEENDGKSPSIDITTSRLTKLEFLSAPGDGKETPTVLLSIVDKTDRIHGFLTSRTTATTTTAGGSNTNAKSKPPPPSFASHLALLRAKVTERQRQLDRHTLEHHTQQDHRSSSQEDLDDVAERGLLALSDGDGLSVSACMLDILSSIHRSLLSFQAKLLDLVQLIQRGTARTNHRRAFVNNVFFLPVFSQIQQFTLALVNHQMDHLKFVASHQFDGRTGTKLICSKTLEMEQIQRKVLLFITAFEGCTSSAEGAQKSADKALLLAAQFLDSKPLRAALSEAIKE